WMRCVHSLWSRSVCARSAFALGLGRARSARTMRGGSVIAGGRGSPNKTQTNEVMGRIMGFSSRCDAWAGVPQNVVSPSAPALWLVAAADLADHFTRFLHEFRAIVMPPASRPVPLDELVDDRDCRDCLSDHDYVRWRAHCRSPGSTSCSHCS